MEEGAVAVVDVTMNWDLGWQKKMRIIILILLAATVCTPVFAQRLSITPPAVTVVEGDSEEFSVVLSSEPTGDVTVTIMRQDGTEVRLNRTELTFTSENWNVPQMVRLVAAEDEDLVDNNGVLILIASGGGLAGGGITLSPEPAIIDLPGETAQLTATVRDQDGETVSGIALEWSSADPSVATVDSDGRVTAVGFGKTTVTAALAAASGTATIWVDDPGNTLISERQILEILFKTTGGEKWRNQKGWLTRRSLSTWSGVTTDTEGYVTELDLTSNNLTGIIPPSLGRLSKLEKLKLSGNSLTGPIPPELGNLEQLKGLWLAVNSLTGPIPPEFGNLKQLKELHLYTNELTGTIPSELGNLTQLTKLFLDSNNLTGSIPPELGNLARLKIMYLNFNSLTGSIPSELGNLTQLEVLSMFHNSLTGSIPPELGKLSRLKELNLVRNNLTGSIPPELGDLAQLEILFLRRNSLTGSIPPELGKLTQLKELYLGRNNLTGSIPPELGNLTQLEIIWLFKNDLTGPIPSELGNLTKLIKLYFDDNKFSGPIPSELGNLTQLRVFWIHKNDLIGPIPPELGNLTKLENLALSDNFLTGPIPSEFNNLTSLTTLRLHNNANLDGFLPRSFLRLNLRLLHIDGTGVCIPQDAVFQNWWNNIPDREDEFCASRKIERLALVELHNTTNGASWTNAVGWGGSEPLNNWYGVTIENGRVTELSLPSNGLTGPISGEIGNFTELTVLNLAGNSLTGVLPKEILSLSELTELHVNGNAGLDGIFDKELVNRLAKLEVLHFGGTSICASPIPTFQEWYADLNDTSGEICGNPDEVRLNIPVAYLTQSIQSPERSVRLIEGRDALLRVFVTGEPGPAFFEHEVVATIRAGSRTHQVKMKRAASQLLIETDESDLNNSFNAVIPGDMITSDATMVVEVDPDGVIPRAAGSQDRFPAVGEERLNVVSVPAMEVTVVPVLEANEPDRSIFEWTDNISDNSPEVGLLKYAFPFHEFGARSREAYVTSLDLVSDYGQWDLVLELEALRLLDGGTGYYYGAAASVNGYVRGVAQLGGWTSMGKALDTELAHEVGHNLNLKHAPCGGPDFTDPDYPHAGGSVGVWGFDFRDSTLISPRFHKDIMGYCYGQGWISDYFFEKVIDFRERVVGKNGRPMAGAPVAEDVLVLWGGVQGGVLRMEPPFSATAPAQLPDTDGPYRLEGLGQQDDILFSFSFMPGEDKFGNKYFFFAIPIEQEWEESLDRIVLTNPEQSVTMNTNDQRALSILRDTNTGQVRGILRDWDGNLPAALEQSGNFNATTIRGLRDSIRLQR